MRFSLESKMGTSKQSHHSRDKITLQNGTRPSLHIRNSNKSTLTKLKKKSSRTHKREKSKLLKPSFMFSLITLNISLFCNPKKKNSNLFPCIKPNTLPLYSHPMCFCRIAGLIFLLYINTSLLKVLFCQQRGFIHMHLSLIFLSFNHSTKLISMSCMFDTL